MDIDELRYYYNCVLEFEEVYSRTIDAPRSRPSWLPPPDIRICQVVALPPMTSLSRLHLHLGLSQKRPYTMSIIDDPRIRLPQLCWLVSLNPGLIDLGLFGFPLMDSRDGRRFGGAIAGLSKLKKLSVVIHCDEDDLEELWSYVFFSCPPAIQQLELKLESIENNLIYESPPGAGNDSEGEDDGEEEEEEEVAAEAVPYVRRQGPLPNLEDLSFLPNHSSYRDSLTDIRSMFTHCPNIKTLSAWIQAGDATIETMGEFIASSCPKIENLIYGSYEGERHDAEAYRIMASLPAQQVTKVEFHGCPLKIIDPAFDAGIQQHSTTLREIRILDDNTPARFSASTILKECRNLEVLFVQYSHDSGNHITLDDALKSPWGCTKLQELAIAISGCELPNEPGVLPYYARQAPITLSETEAHHFSRLEELYRRIGTLTRIEHLDLTMATTHHDYNELSQNPTAFPALLSTGDTFTGRPGFLHHLSGLRKLNRLQGSVAAETDETKVTMGWPEVVWMDQAWPSLQNAAFFSTKKKVTAPFTWLQNRRQNGRVGLRVASHVTLY